ncbi:MAG TPA: hypothetical protein VMT00_04800 [Thermoanaerobaculia bacterium]|nr:hypothetical protein [Thermoanaerobaculia bacterium]
MEDIVTVIRTLNEMERDGAIERYAIGGAVAAAFYLEPADTVDVDVFVPVSAPSGSLVVTLDQLAQYLTRTGHEMKNEYFIIGGWPVQFLPSSPGLIEDAIAEAEELDLGEITARVFRPIHLAAIALQTGRSKDKLRVVQFREAGFLAPEVFEPFLSRYGLLDRWKAFMQQFPADENA